MVSHAHLVAWAIRRDGDGLRRSRDVGFVRLTHRLKSGNAVSTGALASMGFWGIDALITTQKGKPIAMLKSLDDKARFYPSAAHHPDNA
jgi:hypothetical protein